jgi:hypothetical protein
MDEKNVIYDIVLSYNEIQYNELLNERDEEIKQLEDKVEQLCDLLSLQAKKLEGYIKQIDDIKNEMTKIYNS